jgi:hypothetical protein
MGSVSSELNRLIMQDNLPTGLGAGAPVYFVFLPSYVNECSSGSSCATNTFCALVTEISGTWRSSMSSSTSAPHGS